MGTELSLLGEIVTLSCDPSVNLDEFLDKVASSPGLAAEVVRAGNSALYGMEGKIDRLQRAVTILGPRAVASIASAVVVHHALGNAGIGGLEGEAIWMHSLETGECARILALHLDPRIDHQAYLAGLFHHLGSGDAPGDPMESSGTFPAALRSVLGDHRPVGEVPEPSRSLAALVRAAHAAVRDPRAGWKDDVPGDEELLADLGLLDDEICGIRRSVHERVKELVAVFG